MYTRLAPYLFVIIWATGFVGARLGMPHSEAGTFLTIRFSAACVLLACFAILVRAPWPGLKLAGHGIVIGMLLHGFYLGGVFWAVERGMPAGVAAVIVGLQPILTSLLAGWWLKETISSRHWMGMAIGFLGVVLVLLPKLNVSDAGINISTISACLFAMASVTLGTLYQKAIGGQMDMKVGTPLQFLGACIPVFLLAFLFETNEIDWNGEMIVAMVWAIFVLSIGAIFLLMWLIAQDSVSTISSLFFLVPAVATVMAYFLFGETLVLVQLLGMALCAAGVALATYKKRASVLKDN